MNFFRAKTSFGQQSPLIVTKGNGLHAQGSSFWDKDKAMACINRNLLIQTIACLSLEWNASSFSRYTRRLKAQFHLLFSKKPILVLEKKLELPNIFDIIFLEETV